MGKLFRYVVCHEVGHTLGLPHNMLASATYTVKQLRDPEFTTKNGTSPSIMDYARFNYVAQPGDGVTNFVPHIGPYDIHSIRWGYRPIPEAKSAEEEKPILHQWILNKFDDPIYRFNDGSSYDPRAQSESLGDDPVLASELGIENLKIIVNNLLKWTYRPAEDYSQLEELYTNVIGQWTRYMGHVSLCIGGIYKTRKTMDQAGEVFSLLPKEKQKAAVRFYDEQVFTTPVWMINTEILNRIQHAGIVDRIRSLQAGVLARILDFHRLQRLIESEVSYGNKAYTLGNLFHDLHQAIWSELLDGSPVLKKGTAIDIYRRNLQKAYLERLEFLLSNEPTPIPAQYRAFVERTEVDASQSDIRSFVKGELKGIEKRIAGIIGQIKDQPTRFHLEDIADRITLILRPLPAADQK